MMAMIRFCKNNASVSRATEQVFTRERGKQRSTDDGDHDDDDHDHDDHNHDDHDRDDTDDDDIDDDDADNGDYDK